MALRLIRSIALMAMFFMPVQAFAVLKVEITGGSDGALPIAIVPSPGCNNQGYSS